MTRSRTGAAGPWFVICAAMLTAGLAFEFTALPEPAFWVVARAGAAAAIGAGAAGFVVIGANLARLLLARRSGAERQGDADHG